MSGIKVALPGTAPEEFHRRDQFRLEIELPSPWKTIYALGHIRQIKASREGKKMTLLGIKFESLTAKDAKKLNEFIYGDTHVEP